MSEKSKANRAASPAKSAKPRPRGSLTYSAATDEPESEFPGYACFESIGEHRIQASVHITTDKENMLSWKEAFGSETAPEEQTTSAKPEESPSQESAPEDLHAFLIRARESLTAFHPMIAATSVLMPALRASFIHDKMYASAAKELKSVHRSDSYEIFGIELDKYHKINRQIRRLKELDKGMDLMPPAVLMSMVATFDYLLSDLVRILLFHRPKKIDNSSKTLTVKEILSMDSFEELRMKVIDDEIDSLMRSSHDDQVIYIEQNFGIKIRDTYDRWSQFMEIFERRNLAAHGNLLVNRLYVTNCASFGCKSDDVKVGQPLQLTQKYLKESADTLLEFILLAVLVLWRKTIPEESKVAGEAFADEMYELIRDGRTRPAARLLEFSLNKQNLPVDDIYKKMMTINLSIALIKEGDLGDGLAVLDGTDWTAASDEFQLCNAAIRENIEEVVRLMPLVVSGGKASKRDFREWPAFDWVRSSQPFKDKFKDIFDEDIIGEATSASSALSLKLDHFGV